jgi:KDO2-lipid IV(A) lauroyltransferase
LHRSAAFSAVLRFAPATVMRAVRAIARRDAAASAGQMQQLVENFRRAFPQLDAPGVKDLCARHRESQYQCGVIHHHLRGLDRQGLRRHAERDVHYRCAATVERLARHSGPVVLLTPHYGTYLSASLKLLADVGPHKPFSIFFDDPSKNSTTGDYESIYRRYASGATVLFNNRRSVVTALKALQRHETLTMMPDVYEIGANHVVVPFLGGLTHAMTGTAFFALKSRALLVPVYSRPLRGLRCEVDVLDPIPLSDAEDFEQALYETTAAIFASMQARLLEQPEHWVYWSELNRRIASETRIPEYADGECHGHLGALLAELKAQTPGLEPMLEEVARRARLLNDPVSVRSTSP